ncbi:hypothetical protein [Chitinophaga tropicalis]|uniref:Uncharacterized protein n=1 Tax=Chitinophaga tropicalis TaxID=2683588 RepID=A0A7K1U5Q9_9BACT|nr:hypothetical protein [Chitinophaga tropicalis]MVT09702.1 hypothetical protein [Chitinophaga tropicalis]
MSTELYKLTVAATGVMSEFAHLTLYNGYLDVIAKGYEVLEMELPRGLYSVTMKLDGNIISENIRLEKETRHEIATPPIYSSLVAAQYQSTQDYYKGYATLYSKIPTVGAQIKDAGSLFLFFRYTDEQNNKSINQEHALPMGEGFSLLNAGRQVLYKLEHDNVQQDLDEGWLAFHVCLPPGFYYLHYEGRPINPLWEKDKGQPPREIPLQVFKSDDSLEALKDKYWQTQVFLTFGHGPIFPSMSVFIMPKESGFISNDESYYRIDGVRHKFHNGVYFLPEKVMREFAIGQFTSPMKGLLAAYIYFNNNETQDDALFRELMQNLPALLGEGCPDLEALKILSAWYYKEPVPQVDMSRPGMFIDGVRAAIQASLNQPGIIKEDSLLEDITDRLYCDMVWTSYEPLPLPRKAPEHTFVPNSILYALEQAIPANATAEQISAGILNSNTISTVLYYIEKLDTEIEINDLAKRLQLPPNVIKKTIRNILAFPDSLKDIRNQAVLFQINKLKESI